MNMKYSNKTYEDILNWLDTNLTQDRYIHTLGTVDTAVMLAERFNLDVDKARIGALLHDCAKCFSSEKLRQILNDTNIVIEDSELVNYKTLHAPVSAFIAENDFGVTDPEILSSIRWHTLGRVKMSDLEKVVFLADKIEGKTRDEDYRAQILQILDTQGIDNAILECMRTTIKSLIDRNLKICNQTIDVYNRFLDA